MKSYLLDVVGVYFNPLRWKSRQALFQEFIRHMVDSGVRLTVVECAFGERPVEINPPRREVNIVRVRTKSMVWVKESLINLGISRLPNDWRYVCWADGDLKFRHPEWASEAVHALQQYRVIQPWAHCYDLGPHGEHLQLHHSYCKQYQRAAAPSPVKGCEGIFGHPGYVWCMSREAVEGTNGLIETAAVGAGDHHMARAIVGEARSSFPSGVSEGYARPILQWERRALNHIQKSIGYLPHTIEHFWHGPKPKRRYIERWDIVIKHQFDPFEDLKRNVFGVLELAGNKPDLTRDIEIYFLLRDEDSNEWDYFSN